MPITNYSELKTAVATTWQGGRLDLVANAPDWIDLAEDWLNAELPLRPMWTQVQLTGTLGSNLVPLPADFVEPGPTLFLTTYNVQQPLKPTAALTKPDSFVASTPTEYMILGDNIELNHPCDRPHTFLFGYRKAFALSDAQPTNYLLTKYPSIYLEASLVEAFSMTDNPDALQLWGARRTLSRDRIARLEAKSLAIGTLEVDSALLHPAGFNIYAG
jgi:hypothetical protein